MYRLHGSILVAILAAAIATHAQAPSPSGSLQVRRVVLYKNGVGYFEHMGRVVGNQDVNVSFTSAQLDDALKSLTALDLGDGQVTKVSYNSSAPLEQRLAGIGLQLGDVGNVSGFFTALRGARLEVRTGAQATSGRLLTVEIRVLASRGDGRETVTMLSLIDERGAVRSVDLTVASTVRLLDTDLVDRVGQYLAVVAGEHNRDERRLTISTRGTGPRDVFVSYTSEVPVWKATYRLLMPDAARRTPLLQGWAIVDNTVGEDWTDVELSLVAGAPQSFVQRLSQPYYVRRPVVPMPSDLQVQPQMHAGGAVQNKDMAFGFAGPLEEAITVTGTSPMPASPPARGEISHAFGAELAADARELGDYFEYRIKERVTVRRNQSALVPILQSPVTADRVSLWNSGLGGNRPLRAVWMTNTSDLTLDGGTFTLMDGGAFAGEGLLDAIKPGERRLLSYARDLGVTVDAKTEPERRRMSRLRTEGGLFVEQRETCGRRTYVIRNDDGEARAVLVEHAVRPGWTLVAGGPAPAETTPAAHRFRTEVAPRTTATLIVNEVNVGESRYAVSQMTPQQLDYFVRDNGLDVQSAQALRDVLQKRTALAEFTREREAREKESARIREEQGRVRENIGALKSTAEERRLVQRYVSQLNAQEDRLETLSREVTDIQRQEREAQAALDATVKALALEFTASPGASCAAAR